MNKGEEKGTERSGEMRIGGSLLPLYLSRNQDLLVLAPVAVSSLMCVLKIEVISSNLSPLDIAGSGYFIPIYVQTNKAAGGSNSHSTTMICR